MLFWSENCLIPTISPDCQQMSTATLLVHRSPFYWYSGKIRFWQKDLLWFLCKQIASFSLFIHRSVNKMRNQLYVYVIKDTLILWHKVSLFWQPWNGMNITTWYKQYIEQTIKRSPEQLIASSTNGKMDMGFLWWNNEIFSTSWFGVH